MGAFDDLIPTATPVESRGAFADLIPATEGRAGTFDDNFLWAQQTYPELPPKLHGQIAAERTKHQTLDFSRQDPKTLKPKPNIWGDLGERIGAFPRGAAQIIPSTIKTASRLGTALSMPIPTEPDLELTEYSKALEVWRQENAPAASPLYETGQTIEEAIQTAYPPLSPADTDVWDATVQGAGQMGSMLAGGGLVRAAGAGAKGVVAAATLMGGVQEFDDAHSRAVARGDTPDTAFAKSLGYASIASLIENRLGAGRLLRQWFPDALTAAKKLTALGVSKTLIGNALAGAAEEGSQRWMQNLIVEGQASTEGVLEEAIPGGIVEGLFGLPGGVQENIESGAEYQAQQAQEERRRQIADRVALEATIPEGSPVIEPKPRSLGSRLRGAFDDLVPQGTAGANQGEVAAAEAEGAPAKSDEVRAALAATPGGDIVTPKGTNRVTELTNPVTEGGQKAVQANAPVREYTVADALKDLPGMMQDLKATLEKNQIAKGGENNGKETLQGRKEGQITSESALQPSTESSASATTTPAAATPAAGGSVVNLLRQEGLSESTAKRLAAGEITANDAVDETLPNIVQPGSNQGHDEAYAEAREQALTRLNQIVGKPKRGKKKLGASVASATTVANAPQAPTDTGAGRFADLVSARPEPTADQMDYGAGGEMPRNAWAVAGANGTVKPGSLAEARRLMESRLGGKSRHGVEPVTAHVNRVAEQFPNDEVLQTIALLHDVVEDSDTPIQEITSQFGQRIGSAVDALTRREGEDYEAFIERVAQNPDARQVKLKDLADNRNVSPEAAKVPKLARLQERYAKAWRRLGGQEMPAAESSAADAGRAVSKDSMRAEESGLQALPSQDSMAKTPSLEASRPKPPSSQTTGPRSTRLTLGTLEVDPLTGKKIYQQSDDVKENLAKAKEKEPILRAALQSFAEETGAELDMKHPLKTEKRVREKLQQRPAKSISDYLRARFIANTNEELQRLVDLVFEKFPVVQYDDMLTNPLPDSNYFGVHFQLDLGDGFTAELQIHPRELTEAVHEFHPVHEKWNNLIKAKVKLTPEQEAEMLADYDRMRAGYKQAREMFLAKTGARAYPASQDAGQLQQSGDGGERAGGSQPAAPGGPGDVGQAGGPAESAGGGVQSAVRPDAGQPAGPGSGVRGGTTVADADGVSAEQESETADAGATATGGAATGGVGGITAGPSLPGEQSRPNLRLTSNPAPTGAVARIQANIKAIRTLRDLEKSDAQPTPEQITALAAWSGWGSFKELFNDRKAERRDWDVSWSKRYGKYYDQLRDLLTDEEFNAAAESSVNAHYTSQQMIDWQWKLATRLGFHGGRALEPSEGSGLYIGFQPDDLAANTQWTAVELDRITGKIASYLYPQVDTRIEGFEETKLPNGFFDLAISNVPFHRTGPGKEYPKLNLHNYFIARMLDKTRPGGLVIAISTHNTMDANTSQREFLATKGDLVGAIRLPNNAFKESAATEVVTDVLVFRKPDGKPFAAERWANVVDVAPPAKEGEKAVPMMVNEYFANHPEMVLGKHATTGSMYGSDEYTVEGKGNLADLLDKALEKFPENITGPGAATDTKTQTQLEDYSLVLDDRGFVMEARNYELHMPTWDASKPSLVAVAKKYIGVRDVLGKQIAMERDGQASAEEIEANRKQLTKAYRALRKQLEGGKNGSYLSYNHSKMRHLRSDPLFYTVLALERTKLVKDPNDPAKQNQQVFEADILTKRVLQPDAPPGKADNAVEALAVSMAYKGELDMEYIQSLTGWGAEQITSELLTNNLAFEDPETGRVKTTEEYLTGDVRDKLAKAMFAAKEDAKYARNVEALKKVIPPDIDFNEIAYGIDARWIPTTVHNEFARSVMGLSGDLVRLVAKTGEFGVAGSDYRSRRESVSEQTKQNWSTPERSAMELLEHALNNRRALVKVEIEKGKTRTDDAATERANKIIDKIKAEFVKWTKTTDARLAYQYFDADRGEYVTPELSISDIMQREFNRQKNSWVMPEVDGSKLALPGASDWLYRKKHFMDAVMMAVQHGNKVFAHGVGSGKTPLIVVVGHELQRIGLAKKVVTVIKKPTVEQFRRTIEDIYPGSKVLIPTEDDFKKENRRRLISRISTGNYDHIVLTHEQLRAIRPSEKALRAFFDEHINALRDILAELGQAGAENAKSTRGMSREVANLVQRIKTLRKQLDKKITQLKRHHDTGQAWEELGVDAILVDESHNFKNMPIATQQKVKGVPSSFSQRAVDMLIKLRDVQRRTNGRNTFYFTGTPVSNTLAELWVGLYATNPKLLDSLGLSTFDSFTSTYAEITSNFEFGWDNQFKTVTRMNKFKNGRALTALTRMGMDVRIGNKELGMDVPELIGGAPQIRTVKSNPAFQKWLDFLEDIAMEWADLEPKEKWLNSWVPVATMRAGVAAALDPRCVFPDAEDHPDSKVNQAVRDIFKEWQTGKDRRTTMMVFADMYRTLNTDKLQRFLAGERDIVQKDAEARKAKAAATRAAKASGSDLADIQEADEDAESPEDPNAEEVETSVKDEADYEANAVGQFNLYNDIREKLVKLGVPRDEIGIATEHDTDAKRNVLFDKVRAGTVRILIGSTEKIGEGVDVPQRMSAQFHLDPPMQMTPAKQEQRFGRAIRQGNLHSPKHWNIPIGIWLYAQERSMDAPIYNMLLTKLKMVTQALKGQYLGDSFEDPATELTAAMAELIAQATGDTRALDLAKLTEHVRQLRVEEQAHFRELSDTQRTMESHANEAAFFGRMADREERFAQVADRAAGDPDKLSVMFPGLTEPLTDLKAIRAASRELLTKLEASLAKKGDSNGVVVDFGHGLYGLAYGEADMERGEDGAPVLKKRFNITYTVSDQKPAYVGTRWVNAEYREGAVHNEGIITGALSLGARMKSEAEAHRKRQQDATAAAESWRTKLASIGQFEQAAELKDAEARLAVLQKELQGGGLLSPRALARKARKTGRLLEVNPMEKKPAELERAQVRREIEDIESGDWGGADIRREIEDRLENIREAEARRAELMKMVEEADPTSYMRGVYERRADEQKENIAEYQKEIDELRGKEATQRQEAIAPKMTRLAELEQSLLTWLDKAIEATNYDPTQAREGVTGAPAWFTKAAANGVLRLMRAGLKAGMRAADAVAEGLKWLRGQNLTGYNEEQAREWLDSVVGGEGVPGEVDLDTAIQLAERRLLDAIRTHMNPPQGVTKAAALRRKNAAAAKLNTLLAEQLAAMTDTSAVALDPKQTADLISRTVDLLNAVLDDITQRRTEGRPVPGSLTKLKNDLQTRLNILKRWTDDQAELAEKAKPAAKPPARDPRTTELESATDPERSTWPQWLAKLRLGLRYLTNPIPELPVLGDASTAAFRRGFRLFQVENNRVRKDAQERIENVLEPLTKLGRKPADNVALREYYRLGEALQRAKMDEAKTKAIRERMNRLEETLNQDPFNLFRKLVLYRDLWWRGTYLKNDQGKPITLPLGLTVDDVAAELRRLTDQIAQHRDGAAIAEAVKRHYKLTDDLQKSILEHGEIIPEALRNPLYFPHHIIDNWTGKLDRVRPTTEEDFRRYLIAPMGSGKLIQTDYLKAMYLHTADVLAHNARVDLVQKYWQPYDISQRLKDQFGDDWDKPWNIPGGYKVLNPFKKLPLRMDYILTREVLAEKLGVLFNDGDLRNRLGEAGGVLKVKPEDLSAALVAGEKIKWVLPEAIADAIEGIARREMAKSNPGLGHAIGLPVRKVVGFWKGLKLFAPWNWLRYEYGNLSTDAIDKVLAADPGAAKYLARAANEVWRAADPEFNPSEEFKAASREGVFETVTAGEAGALIEQPAFSEFLTPGEQRLATVKKVLAGPARGSKFRESVFRYAKFLADLERIRNGEHPVYAGAFHGDIEALGEWRKLSGAELQYAKAAEISLKTFGDYNQLSVVSQWLREYAVPFWSWQDVNFRYHANQIRNIADGIKGVPGATSRQAALRYAGIRVIGTLIAVGLAKELWNQFGGPLMGLWDDDDDLEQNLSAQDRRRGHLIMGKDDKGQTIVVYTPSAWGDVAEWVGGQNLKRLFLEWVRGEITLDQFISDYAKQLPQDTLNKLAQSVGPTFKGPYELASGRATFPDVLDQRSIPQSDRFWRLLGTMTDDRAVNWLRGVFDRDYYEQPAADQLQQIVLQMRRRDAEQWAYFEARDRAADWKEARTGKRFEAGDYNAPEAQVLRNFRRAIYRGDAVAAVQFYERLLEFGYTAERLDASIRNAHPLADLSATERPLYTAQLDQRGKEQLAQAQRYYARLAALDRREKQLFPKKGQPARPNPALLRSIVETQSRNRNASTNTNPP